ncbi:hypothetical protein M8J76_016400 [Diaphorina citri]|nr:hypothetical protein M8J76_016400 [Diaphorina citri]
MSMNNLQWLKGTWKSISAQGIYPTINSFKYIETLSITQPKNKPYFNYLSNTINNEEIQQPMHCEYGFIRLLPNNSICLQLAHNFGVNTVEKGVLSDVNDKEFHLETTSIVRAVENPNPEKAKVVKLCRHYKLNDKNQLEQVVEMETDKTEMSRHLTVIYEKISEDGKS